MFRIFEIIIGKESREEIYEFVDSTLSEFAQKKCIVTLNPEILLFARSNVEYRNFINKADLKVVDGFGIKLVSFLKRMKVGERMAGVDLSGYVLKKSIEKNLKVGLIVRKDGLSDKEELKKVFKEYSNVEIVECGRGEELNLDNAFEVLFVGLGPPYQEVFISKVKNALPKLKLAIGVGGTFDFWTGKRKRAPKFLRKAGLEWVWRGMIQPNRFFRILNSTIIFLALALSDKKD